MIAASIELPGLDRGKTNQGKVDVPGEIQKSSELRERAPDAPSPRVMHLIGSFNEGGSERQALQLVGLLHRHNRYQVRLASLVSSGRLRSQADALGVGEILSYPLTSFYNIQFLTQVRRFAEQLRKLEISIVHCHDFYTNIFGMAAAALAKVPVRIASRRDLGVIRSAKQGFVERRAYWFADRIIANSVAVRKQLIEEKVSSEKIVVIYNGLDPERVSVSPEFDRDRMLASLNVSPIAAKQIVTIVANFRLPAKDQTTFLRAAQKVLQQMPDTVFLLAGEGELQTNMRALANEFGITHRALFIGRYENIGELLAISDVCVLSSQSEGFSNSILEYMAAGRPVVATRVGGAPELIVEGETGFLVPPGDDAALSERILILLRDPKRAGEMGLRGRERVLQSFSCESQLVTTEQIYSVLLSSRHALPK